MGWHDSTIYGMIFDKTSDVYESNLLFDIDYIFKWINPVPPSNYYTFWISPCTLKFIGVFDLSIKIEDDGLCLSTWEISDIILISKEELELNKTIYEWGLELQNGKIKFKSFGYQQYVKALPQHVKKQELEMDSRRSIVQI